MNGRSTRFNSVYISIILLIILAACTDSTWRHDPAVEAARNACKSQSGVDYDCVEHEAVSASNPEICRLVGIYIDDMCLQAVYEAADDPSICDRIYLRGVVPNCRAYYAHYTPEMPLPTGTFEIPNLTQTLPSIFTLPPTAALISRPTPTTSPNMILIQTPLPTPSSTSSPSLDSGPIFKRTAQSGGSINGITAVGDIAYIGMGPRVAVIDISEHETPRLVAQSQPLPGLVTHLLVISTEPSLQLLISAGKYLVMMDISDSETLEPIHQLALPGAITAMVLNASESILYVGGVIYQAPYQYTGYIAAVDVITEHGLKLIDSVTLPEQPISIAVGKDSVFAGTESYEGGLYHIQLETSGILSMPHLVIGSTTENYFAPYSMQVIGKRLYTGVYMEIHAYDITNPDKPLQVWKEFTGIMVKGFSIEGEQIDIFGWIPAGAYIPGRKAVTPPEPVAGYPIGQVASIVAVHNGYFMVAYHDLEIYSPPDLELAGRYQSAVTSVLGTAADDRAVYVVDGGVVNSRENATLRIFSLPDLDPLGVVTTEVPSSCCWYSGIAIEGDRAYIAAKDNLWVYDISSDFPTLLAKPEIIDGELFAIAAIQQGNRRFLFTSQDVADLSVMTVYDLTDPQKLVKIGNPLYLDRGRIHQMTWNGSSLYAILTAIIEGESDLLYVVDLQKDSLSLQGSLQVPGRIFSMAVDDGLVALAGTDGLAVISVVKPESPQLAAHVPLPELGLRVAILRNRALVVSGGNYGTAQLLVFDIQNPANPRQVNTMDVAFSAGLIGPMPVSEPYIVLTIGSSGVDVLEYQEQK